MNENDLTERFIKDLREKADKMERMHTLRKELILDIQEYLKKNCTLSSITSVKDESEIMTVLYKENEFQLEIKIEGKIK